MASAAVAEGVAPPPHALPALDSFECPVCLDLLVQPVCASCGHDFCKFCYEAWVRESRLDSPVCPICRQDISAVCPGVCLRMENTISVLFPEKLGVRVAEVELHKQQHAELQALRDAQHAQALRRLYSRIVDMISSLRSAAPTDAPPADSAAAAAPASQEPPTDGNASGANAHDDIDGDAMDATSLARTLDSFMNTAVSANAWQDGPPLLTLVFTIGRNGDGGIRDRPRDAARLGDALLNRRSPRLPHPWRNPLARPPTDGNAPRRQSARLRNRRAGEGAPPTDEGPDNNSP